MLDAGLTVSGTACNLQRFTFEPATVVAALARP
jgi:hypothetical protein